jgi:nicotinate-nucleotide adenylyltransferase
VSQSLSVITREKPVVVFGGTFDPPHIGHLVVADDVLWRVGASAVLFVPAATPPHKLDANAAPEARLEMVKLVAAADKRFVACGLEVERGGVSYTVDTVNQLKADGFGDIVLAVGADNLAEMTSWKDWERLVEDARVMILSRPGYGFDCPPAVRAGVEMLEVTPIPVSSTTVRERARAGKPFRYLVPPAVYRYIIENGLYR